MFGHPVAAVLVVALVVIGALGGLAWRVSQQRAREATQAALTDAKFALSQGADREALRKADLALGYDPDLTVEVDAVTEVLASDTFTLVELEQALADGGYDPEDEMTVDGSVTEGSSASGPSRSWSVASGSRT